MIERILVIVAHPDDSEFGVAGSVAMWTAQSIAVTYCIITDGASGSNDPTANGAAVAIQRQHEQRAAAALLGVHDVRFLGYHDGTLTPSLELRRDLTRVIRAVRPQRVVCQDPTTYFVGNRYINHPDHRAAGEAALYAVFPAAETRPIFPELVAEGYEPHHVDEVYMTLSPQHDVFVDISHTIEQKIAALLCHASQVGNDVAAWVKERNAELGATAHCAYAEAYRVMLLYHDRDSQQLT